MQVHEREGDPLFRGGEFRFVASAVAPHFIQGLAGGGASHPASGAQEQGKVCGTLPFLPSIGTELGFDWSNGIAQKLSIEA